MIIESMENIPDLHILQRHKNGLKINEYYVNQNLFSHDIQRFTKSGWSVIRPKNQD